MSEPRSELIDNSGQSTSHQQSDSQEPPLTRKFVSDNIKEAVGSFKDYLDYSLAKAKSESEKKLSAASSELQQLKRAADSSFRFKGNKTQFEFNSSLQEKLEKGVAFLEDGNQISALEEFKGGVSDLKKRKKLIRLADKSDAG